jgi:CubicO group peptidase (beta-lactamase class C family)
MFFALLLFAADFYFPPPGESLERQQKIKAEAAGLEAGVIDSLEPLAPRWALWHKGRLIHVKGDFNELAEVASHRKTWHAMAVGAAIQKKRIHLSEPLSKWNPELKGKDRRATWRHVLVQASGFDYPDKGPGEIWTYSDLNLIQLCNAIARVFGHRNYRDDYDAVLREAYFDEIGMRGWRTSIKDYDDAIRLHLDLEDMGRLGLLVLTGGRWKTKQLVPEKFVLDLETKQTAGLPVNYNGPNDGQIGLDPAMYPEAPYGYLTWTNADGKCNPGAGKQWAFAWGNRGNYTLWNRQLGIVFAAIGMPRTYFHQGAPQIIERHLKSK